MQLDSAVFVRPMLGEAVCGDSAFVIERADGWVLGLIDGMGHGPAARLSATKGEAAMRESPESSPVALLELLHRALLGTAGAAAGVAHIDSSGSRLAYAGIGNVSARVAGREDVRFVNRDGVLGQRFRAPRVQELELHEKGLFVMHSDGVSDRFDADAVPELNWAPASRLASLLVSRFGKSHDDASCLVARYVS